MYTFPFLLLFWIHLKGGTYQQQQHNTPAYNRIKILNSFLFFFFVLYAVEENLDPNFSLFSQFFAFPIFLGYNSLLQRVRSLTTRKTSTTWRRDEETKGRKGSRGGSIKWRRIFIFSIIYLSFWRLEFGCRVDEEPSERQGGNICFIFLAFTSFWLNENEARRNIM